MLKLLVLPLILVGLVVLPLRSGVRLALVFRLILLPKIAGAVVGFSSAPSGGSNLSQGRGPVRRCPCSFPRPCRPPGLPDHPSGREAPRPVA
jgi:hypothetical protein